MKKQMMSCLLLIPFLLSCSLYNALFKDQTGTAYFIEGYFIGDLFVGGVCKSKERANLWVKSISKDQFEQANGKNVLKDYNGGDSPYFSLDMEIIKDDSDYYEKIVFNNLKCHPQPGTISYMDENYTYSITPTTGDSITAKDKNKPKYSYYIHVSDQSISYSYFLYLVN